MKFSFPKVALPTMVPLEAVLAPLSMLDVNARLSQTVKVFLDESHCWAGEIVTVLSGFGSEAGAVDVRGLLKKAMAETLVWPERQRRDCVEHVTRYMLWDEAAGAAKIGTERRAKTTSDNILQIIAKSSLEIGTWGKNERWRRLDICRPPVREHRLQKTRTTRYRTPGTDKYRYVYMMFTIDAS